MTIRNVMFEYIAERASVIYPFWYPRCEELESNQRAIIASVHLSLQIATRIQRVSLTSRH